MFSAQITAGGREQMDIFGMKQSEQSDVVKVTIGCSDLGLRRGGSQLQMRRRCCCVTSSGLLSAPPLNGTEEAVTSNYIRDDLFDSCFWHLEFASTKRETLVHGLHPR